MSYNVTKAKPSPEKFQTFEDLEVYKAAREFRKAMYSRGSLEELVDDLNVCLDENYLSVDQGTQLKEQASAVLALINGYLRYLRGRSSTVREPGDADSDFMEALEDLPLSRL